MIGGPYRAFIVPVASKNHSGNSQQTSDYSAQIECLASVLTRRRFQASALSFGPPCAVITPALMLRLVSITLAPQKAQEKLVG
jgi:hypothetical protein